MENKYFVINTGLKDKTSESILLNVIGQLSDGMWENSRVMEHYWPFVNIDTDDKGEVRILILLPGSEDYKTYFHHNSSYNNWFIYCNKLNKDPVKIKRWFADKIHRLVTEERKDYPNKGIKFNGKCDVSLCYMYDHNVSGRDHLVSEAYNVYKHLRNCNLKEGE